MRRSRTSELCFKLVTALAVAAAGGCATTTSFRMSSVGPTEAAIAGHLKLSYNGKIVAENCHVTFSGHVFHLKADGIVLLPIEKGWASLEQVVCLNAGILWRETLLPGSTMMRLPVPGAHFFARGEGSVTDFGDVTIAWGDDSVGARIDVGAPAAEVRAAFRRQTGVDGRWVVSLVSQPRSRVEQPPRPDDGSGGDGGAPRLARPHGFFCTSSSQEQDATSFCERTQVGCEHVRSVLGARGTGARGMGACHAAETAWCFVTDGQLRCSETGAACVTARARTVRADLCGEQY